MRASRRPSALVRRFINAGGGGDGSGGLKRPQPVLRQEQQPEATTRKKLAAPLPELTVITVGGDLSQREGERRPSGKSTRSSE